MPDADITYAYVGDVVKSERDANGDLIVYGKATGPDLDLDQQRCDATWLKSAMPAWMRWGNVREQHGAIAAGVGLELTEQGDDWYLKSLVVDPGTAKKVERGVLKGYSIGIKGARVVKSASAVNGIISGGDVCEISLVDRPANASCEISIAKAAGLDMLTPVDAEGDSVVHEGDSVTISKGEAILEQKIEKTPKPSPLNMPGAKKGAAAEQTMASLDSEPFDGVVTTVVEKATDTDHIEAPAPGQTCTDCGEDGHLNCGPTDAVKSEEFDREAAKALVEQITKAAGDGLGQDETGDISGAEQVISQLAQLIVSEAQALADMPSQDCDIHLLMSAVDAVRIFSAREKLEQGAIDPDSMVMLSADAEVTKAKYTADELKQMLKDGKAMKNPNGEPSYPIADKEDLTKAIKAVGRGSGDHDAIRKYIKRRAAALGASDMIPDDWNGSNKAADTEPVETPESTDTVDTEIEKTADPETTKAVLDEDALGKAVSAALEKLFSSDELEKEDNPIRKTLGAIEASTKTIAETLEAQGERLVKVESMATPNGPARCRTDTEVKKSRQQDLELLARAEERKAAHTHDNDLRQGYLSKAMGLRTEAKALQN